MSDAGADQVGERLGRIEGTVQQMDKRLDDMNGRISERFDTLESQIEGNRDEIGQVREEVRHTRTEIRNWFILLAVTISAVVTVVTLLV